MKYFDTHGETRMGLETLKISQLFSRSFVSGITATSKGGPPMTM